MSSGFYKRRRGIVEHVDSGLIDLCLANCFEGPFLPLIVLRERDEFHSRNASVAGNRFLGSSAEVDRIPTARARLR